MANPSRAGDRLPWTVHPSQLLQNTEDLSEDGPFHLQEINDPHAVWDEQPWQAVGSYVGGVFDRALLTDHPALDIPGLETAYAPCLHGDDALMQGEFDSINPHNADSPHQRLPFWSPSIPVFGTEDFTANPDEYHYPAQSSIAASADDFAFDLHSDPQASQSFDSETLPRRSKRRKIARSKSPQGQGTKQKLKKICVEAGCVKAVPLNRDGDRCSRCHAKWIKNNSGPSVVEFDPTIGTREAYELVYTTQPALELDSGVEDDVHLFAAAESAHQWTAQLIEAVNFPYTEPEVQQDDWFVENYLAQQQVYNKKFFDQPDQYNDKMVNARLMFLFEAARRFHAGGQLVYDDGGDNAGYNVNRKLTFSQRMRVMCELLKLDKRIVMDVIEGRGINAFVRDPESYERRKQDNVMSNGKKKAAKAAFTARSTSHTDATTSRLPHSSHHGSTLDQDARQTPTQLGRPRGKGKQRISSSSDPHEYLVEQVAASGSFRHPPSNDAPETGEETVMAASNLPADQVDDLAHDGQDLWRVPGLGMVDATGEMQVAERDFTPALLTVDGYTERVRGHKPTS